MSEILKLEFSAGTQMVLLTLDAIETYKDEKTGETKTRTIIGKPMPVHHFLLTDPLYSEFASRFLALLPSLHDMARAHSEAVVTDPARVREEANKTAQEKMSLAEERLQHERGAQARADMIGKLDAVIAEKKLTAASLDSELASKNRAVENASKAPPIDTGRSPQR